MKKKIPKILLFSILAVAILFIFLTLRLTLNQSDTTVEINGKVIFVEIADDFNERAAGLMFRENLEENSGMLFIFEEEAPVSFWMKNTLIPLDIIFIDSNFEIVSIKNATPCTKDPCINYPSEKPALYVLEVNSGFTDKNNINIGDKIKIEK